MAAKRGHGTGSRKLCEDRQPREADGRNCSGSDVLPLKANFISPGTLAMPPTSCSGQAIIDAPVRQTAHFGPPVITIGTDASATDWWRF